MKRQVKKIYALYRGDKNICDGTISEIAAKQGARYQTISWLTTPTAKKRQHSHKTRQGMRLIFIGNE